MTKPLPRPIPLPSQQLGVDISPSKRNLGAFRRTTQMELKASPYKRRTRSSMFIKRSDSGPNRSEAISLSKAKKIIEDMSKLVHQIILDNESAPDVQTALRHLINGIDEGYPRFNGLATQYFAYVAERRAMGSRQAFATAPIVPAMTKFTKYWDPFVKLIREYNSKRPLPHAKEISVKFKSISTALDQVYDANLKRKYPSQNITNSILNLQTLAEKIDTTITDLYMSENFGSFKSDVAAMYVNDVQAIMQLLLNAFKFDFIQCGLTTHEYQRVKTTITSNCSTIINCLKASFTFVHQIADTVKYINEINDEIQWIRDEIDSKFCVFNGMGLPLFSRENSKKEIVVEEEKPKFDEVLEFVGGNTDESSYKMNPTESKLRLFLHEVMPLVGGVYDDSLDMFQMLDIVERNTRNLDNYITKLQDTIKSKDGVIEEEKSRFFQKEQYYKQHMAQMVQNYNDQKQIFDQALKENVRVLKQRDNWIKEIDTKQQAIDELQLRGDPVFLRNCINKLISRMSEIVDMPTETKSDHSLVKLANDMFDKVLQKHENDIKKLKDSLANSEERFKLLSDEHSKQTNLFITRQASIIKSQSSMSSENEDIKPQFVIPEEKPQIPSQSNSPFGQNQPHVSQLKSGDLQMLQNRRMSKQYNEMMLQKEQKGKVNLKDVVPIVEMMDAVAGTHYAEEDIQELDTLKEYVRKQIEIFTSAIEKLADRITAKEDKIEGIAKIVQSLSSSNDPNLPLEDQIKNYYQEIHSKIEPLEKENEEKEKQIQDLKEKQTALENRIKGIAKDTNASLPEKINAFQALEVIQDVNSNNTNNYKSEKDMTERFRACLKEVETELKRSTGSRKKYSQNDEQLLQNVRKYVDVVCDQNYSSGYTSNSFITSLFKSFLGKDYKNLDPKQYLPVIAKKYGNYSSAFKSLAPIKESFDSLFGSLSSKINLKDDSSMDITYVKESLSSIYTLVSKISRDTEEKIITQVLSQCLTIIQSCLL